ncbi:MAG: SH3 domain-containing protein [Candidatus Omnitrophica bacterium]|nr:SH3 domain-containing protein [Candidatus Omnitrophota bacterium]
MKKIWVLSLVIASLTFAAAPVGEKLNFAAPASIPQTTRQMQRPGFWISLNPLADRVVLNAADVQHFNQTLIANGLVKDVLSMSSLDVQVSSAQIQKEIKKFSRGDYFDHEGKLAPRDFFSRIEDNIVLDNMEDQRPRHAFVIQQCDQRLLPTTDILTAEPFDFEFDEIQNSSLDAGTAVVVFQETLDEQWVYTQTAASAGWVKKENLEFVSSDEFLNQLTAKKFAVVISAKADLYRDRERTQFYDNVRMGMRLAVNGVHADSVEVAIAPRQSLFIHRRDINMGYLTYTPRVIIEQAFKMLNAPYGWGGLNGQQDCSAFLKQVFSTVGIELPRNSSEQGQVGELLGSKGQIETFKKATAGITIAQLKGHIVLYLGMVDQQPYAIHAAFAYRETAGATDQTRVVNRVIVSDLSLGAGTKKGSLLDRIVAIRAIK